MRGSGLGLEVYTDVDYADKANDRRSVSGIGVTLGGTVVSHAGKIQHAVRCRPQRQSTLRLGIGSRKLCLCTPFCLSFRPRRVGQALRSLRTTRGIRC